MYEKDKQRYEHEMDEYITKVKVAADTGDELNKTEDEVAATASTEEVLPDSDGEGDADDDDDDDEEEVATSSEMAGEEEPAETLDKRRSHKICLYSSSRRPTVRCNVEVACVYWNIIWSEFINRHILSGFAFFQF
jgi:hypothetical protein